MSKTIRKENKDFKKYFKNLKTGILEEKTYNSKHNQYIPHQSLSKEYQKYGIEYKGMEFNGHSPQKGSKQRLTQELRAKEKEEARNIIEEALNDKEE